MTPSRAPIRPEAKRILGVLLLWGFVAIWLAFMFLYRLLNDVAGC